MTQVNAQQAMEIQAAKNKKMAFRRIHYRPQSANKLVQCINAGKLNMRGQTTLLSKVVDGVKRAYAKHHVSQPMPSSYSIPWRFFADVKVPSQMQDAFRISLVS